MFTTSTTFLLRTTWNSYVVQGELFVKRLDEVNYEIATFMEQCKIMSWFSFIDMINCHPLGFTKLNGFMWCTLYVSRVSFDIHLKLAIMVCCGVKFDFNFQSQVLDLGKVKNDGIKMGICPKSIPKDSTVWQVHNYIFDITCRLPQAAPELLLALK